VVVGAEDVEDLDRISCSAVREEKETELRYGTVNFEKRKHHNIGYRFFMVLTEIGVSF